LGRKALRLVFVCAVRVLAAILNRGQASLYLLQGMIISMASNSMHFELPEQLLRQLEVIVRATGKSEREVIEQALLEYCARRASDAKQALESCHDLASRTGFLGCDDGGPDDLSVNPAYMEGFGRE
jgi:hypothetical protein